MIAGTLIDDLIAIVERCETRMRHDLRATDRELANVANWYRLAIEKPSANELLGVA